MPADKSSKRKAKRDPDEDEEENDDDAEFEIKPKVKKSESDVESSEEDVKPKKKVKRETPASASAEPEPEPESETEPEPARRAVAPRPAGGDVGDDLIDEDGRPYFLVSDKKRVTLSDFKGKQYVNIREYYTDKADGKDKPGKKGITLDMAQWDLFKTKIGTVDGWIGSSGSGKGKGKGRKK